MGEALNRRNQRISIEKKILFGGFYFFPDSYSHWWLKEKPTFILPTKGLNFDLIEGFVFRNSEISINHLQFVGDTILFSLPDEEKLGILLRICIHLRIHTVFA